MILGEKKISRCLCAACILAKDLVISSTINQLYYILGIVFGCLPLVKVHPSFLRYLAASRKSFGGFYSACLDNLIDIVIDLTFSNQNLFPSLLWSLFFLSVSPVSQLWLFIAVSHKAL